MQVYRIKYSLWKSIVQQRGFAAYHAQAGDSSVDVECIDLV